MTFTEVRGGGKSALARALVQVERRPRAADTIAMLDAAYKAPIGHVLGLTGPPGVGKSTLTSALVAVQRARGASVGVIAVDPSSRRSGGALLGDRTRILTDPEDQGVFVRSMAARDRLGGLAAITYAAMILMRATYDLTIIETVGVGQSETEIADIADTVVFCAQPGAGDALQFMKAGVMETPHIALVTKSDMGQPARRAAADLCGALSLVAPRADGWVPRVLSCSAEQARGVEALLDVVAERAAASALAEARAVQAERWLRAAVQAAFGVEGVRRAQSRLALAPGEAPFPREAEVANLLTAALERGLPKA